MHWFLYDIGLRHERVKESLGLCDIWRIRTPKTKGYTFRQLHVSGFVQRRLDYFLVSNNLQESINEMDILTAPSTGHSPIFFLLSKNIGISSAGVYGNLTTLRVINPISLLN